MSRENSALVQSGGSTSDDGMLVTVLSFLCVALLKVSVKTGRNFRVHSKQNVNEKRKIPCLR